MVVCRCYSQGMERLKPKMSVQFPKVKDVNPGSPTEKTGFIMSFAIDCCI